MRFELPTTPTNSMWAPPDLREWQALCPSVAKMMLVGGTGSHPEALFQFRAASPRDWWGAF